jgi:hypothetical protein
MKYVALGHPFMDELGQYKLECPFMDELNQYKF